MYANVIVDISHEKLDKTFQYSIPEELLSSIKPGVCVDILFGNRTITGYVIEVTDEAEFDPAKTKPLIGIKPGSVAVEAKLIALAAWIRKNYVWQIEIHPRNNCVKQNIKTIWRKSQHEYATSRQC